MARLFPHSPVLALALVLSLTGFGGSALDQLDFVVTGEDARLTADLRAASGLLAAEKTKRTNALDLLADARAEYGRLISALYAKGHYNPVIHVLVDGREAASIAGPAPAYQLAPERHLLDLLGVRRHPLNITMAGAVQCCFRTKELHTVIAVFFEPCRELFRPKAAP